MTRPVRASIAYTNCRLPSAVAAVNHSCRGRSTGRRMAKPFQVDLPGDVLAAGLVPFNGHPAGVAFGGAAVLKGAVSIRPRKFGRPEGPRGQDQQER